MTQDILYELDHLGVARITLNRPEKHNAFDDTMIAELTRCNSPSSSDTCALVDVEGRRGCTAAQAGS